MRISPPRSRVPNTNAASTSAVNTNPARPSPASLAIVKAWSSESYSWRVTTGPNTSVLAADDGSPVSTAGATNQPPDDGTVCTRWAVAPAATWATMCASSAVLRASCDIGPITVAGSRHGPSGSVASSASRRSSSSAATERWTISLPGASHHWPFNFVIPRASAAAVAARSASARTMAGLLPPSSSCNWAKFGAAAAAMARPAARPPVNATTRARRSATSWAPTVAPPCTIWTSPAGRSTWARAAITRSAVKGAHSLGLTITGQPAAMANAARPTMIGEGAFHGAMTTAGPLGARCSTTRP